MKKLFFAAALAATVFSCQKQKDLAVMEDFENAKNVEAVGRRGCASHEVLERQMAEDPSLSTRMKDIEAFAEKAMAEGRIVNGVLEIPVIVNVLYRTTAENISQAQIQSQIDVLNEDFQGRNADFNTPNNPYASVRAVVGYRFVLERINRKATTKTSWGTNDDCKRSSRGGIDATTPTTHLNLWVCTIGNGILGYAQFPGGAAATDGVVLDSRYTGRTGTATAPFNLGRTGTHEVGHWMNLRHIWGDATCGNDFVSDTPVHNAPNYGVPAVGHRSTCSGTPLEMYMNYMDYTDDRGMYMFSLGQKARMDACFAVGGPRASFR